MDFKYVMLIFFMSLFILSFKATIDKSATTAISVTSTLIVMNLTQLIAIPIYIVIRQHILILLLCYENITVLLSRELRFAHIFNLNFHLVLNLISLIGVNNLSVIFSLVLVDFNTTIILQIIALFLLLNFQILQ